MTHDSTMQLFRIRNGASANSIVLQIIPNPLVRIQFRRVRWKKEESKALLNRLGFNKRGNLTCLMRRMPINNKENLTIGTMDQSLNELDKTYRAHAASDNHESEFALGAHRRYHVQSETSSGATHNRRFSLDSPRSARMMVRSHASLVSEEYLRLFSACKATNLRKFFLQPLLDRFRLLLISSPDRTLGRQPELRQQSTDRCFAQFNAKSIENHLPDHFGCPQSIREFQLERIFHRHGAENPPQSRTIQLRRPSTPFTSIQRTPSTVTVSCQPAIHGRASDTHCLSDKFWAMAFVHARHSPLSHCCQSLMVKFSRIGFSHAQQYNRIA